MPNLKGVASLEVSEKGLVDLSNEISKVDSELATAKKSNKPSQKEIKAVILQENAGAAEKVSSQIRDALQKIDAEVLVAAVPSVQAMLKEFSSSIKSTIKSRVESATLAETGVDVKELKEKRKIFVKAFTNIKNVLKELGHDVTSIEDPPKIRKPGGGGKRRKGATNYQFTINGQPRSERQNKLSQVAYAATVGLGEHVSPDGKKRMTAEEFENFIKGQGVDYPNQDKWEVELPNGVKVGAYKLEASTSTEAEAAVA